MSKSNLHALSQPEATKNDPLHDLIRQGARDLIARAVESELQVLLNQYADVLTPDGRKAVVRNGHLPKRTIQTGVGDVDVQVLLAVFGGALSYTNKVRLFPHMGLMDVRKDKSGTYIFE